MKKHTINPFEVTKAVDLSNEQINSLWVDLLGNDHGFKELLKPTSSVPKFFLGGKGSGRTHILKYFSYELQKIRHNDNILHGLEDDGYLGIFFRLGTLAESRFMGMGIDKLVWEKSFKYYMDLSIARKTLSIFYEIYKNASIVIDDNQLSQQISALFTSKDNIFDGLSMKGIINELDSLINQIDYKINNAPFKKVIDIEILVTEGNLIFSLARILTKFLHSSTDVKILYLFDELENISFQHQKYVQTLVRLRKDPVHLIFSGRLYAVDTHRTDCLTGEGDGVPVVNYRNSEFEEIKLDEELRKCANYSSFIKKLCMKRIIESSSYSNYEKIEDAFQYDFNGDDENDEASGKRLNRFATGLFPFLEKKNKYERQYLLKLKKKLDKLRFSANVIDKIMGQLQCYDYPLVEKTSTFLLYKKWSKSKTDRDLINIAEDINKNAKKFLSDTEFKSSSHYKILKHYKQDLIAQVYREHNQPFYYQYTGIDNFIKMSSGIPRSVLSILKEIYRIANFTNENPFIDNSKISKQAQLSGVTAASKIFLDTASDNKSDPQQVKDAINRLASLLSDMRYSDKIGECSSLAFSTDTSKLSNRANENINRAVNMSLLIEENERKGKNSDILEKQYKLTPFLSVLWRLPLVHRGCRPLSSDIVNEIFDFTPTAGKTVGLYDKFKRDKLKLLSVPNFNEDEDVGLGI